MGKPALLLLQGGPGLRREYTLPNLRSLEESHQVYSFQYNGETLPEIFEDLFRQIQQASIQGPIDVLAHSWGSFVLFKLIRDYGFTSLRSVVFVTPAPSKWLGLMAAVERLQRLISERLSPEAQVQLAELKPDGDGPMDRQMIRLLRPCYVGNSIDAEKLQFDSYNRNIHMSVFGEMADYNYDSELASLSGQFALITGEMDFIQPNELKDFQLHARQSFHLPGVGHSPFVEKPDLFINSVRRFFESGTPELSAR